MTSAFLYNQNKPSNSQTLITSRLYSNIQSSDTTLESHLMPNQYIHKCSFSPCLSCFSQTVNSMTHFSHTFHDFFMNCVFYGFNRFHPYFSSKLLYMSSTLMSFMQKTENTFPLIRQNKCKMFAKRITSFYFYFSILSHQMSKNEANI